MKDLVLPVRGAEILHFVQDDGGSVQDDKGRAQDDEGSPQADGGGAHGGAGHALGAIRIAPGPTEEEAAAIVAALLLLEPTAEAAPAAGAVSAWAMAGRRAAQRGMDGGGALGWGRRR